MRVPADLATAFGAPFEELIRQFSYEKKLLPDLEALSNPRFIARSVVPHVQKLSDLFNRTDRLRDKNAPKPPPGSQELGLSAYWKESSNPVNLRLAYFLYFMPCNLYRVASVWAELQRIGYRWPADRSLRAVEFGAGPASGACGIAVGEKFAPTGIPKIGNWALIEQDKPMLDLGAQWAGRYFSDCGFADWGIRTFQRKLEIEGRKSEMLPSSAPRFNLWLMSYFLNELTISPAALAPVLVESWRKHLDQEGLVILVEPALKGQSRKLLELRKALIEEFEKTGDGNEYQILLPCLGHQACGALAAPEDWCHEEVSWWRPPYFRQIDKMAGLDRKTLPFSYLVIARSKRPIAEILPALAGGDPSRRQRLVSPAHSEGKELEFYVCGNSGKQKARYRPTESERTEGKQTDEAVVDRGDILVDTVMRGDSRSARIERFRRIPGRSSQD